MAAALEIEPTTPCLVIPAAWPPCASPILQGPGRKDPGGHVNASRRFGRARYHGNVDNGRHDDGRSD
eukprot:2898903-Pyramimonas_sp.AAC.1